MDIGKRPFSVTRVAIAVLGIAVLFALLMFPLPALVNGSRLLGALANAFHGLLFACVVGLILWLRRNTSWRGYVAAWLITAGLALVTELIQSLGSRDPSWVDVQTDLLGATAATALWPLCFQRRASISWGRRATLASVALVAVVLIFLPVMQPIANWIERGQRFPVLFSAQFSGALGMTESMTELEDVEIAVRDGALFMKLLAGPLPGVVITDFAPDWRGYQTLVIEVENPGTAPLSLEVHVRDFGSSDDRSDRFNAESRLLPGQRVPLRFALSDVAAGPRGRPMRIDALKVIAVYRIEPGSDQLVMHSIRLE